MIKSLLVFALAISSLSVFSQQDSLLKNFKFRINRYTAINFNLGGGGNYDNTDYPSGTTKNSGGGLGLGAGYFTTKSTDKILLTHSANVSSNYSGNKSKSNFGENKAKSFSGGASASLLNKWFNKNKFIELGTDVFGYFNGNKYNSYTPAITKNNQSDFSIALNTGIGIGRLENITNMQNALWLNKALEKSNNLAHPLSAAALNELGQTITNANNTRVLDSRIRTQFILETVDSFFQKNNLISKTDIKYFSNLNDILFFAVNNYRLSGTEKFIRLTPFISNYNNDNSPNNNTDKYEGMAIVKSLNFSVGLNKYIPLNLTHQNNYGASLGLIYISQKYSDKIFNADTLTSELKNNPTTKQAALDLFFEHAIYPNTRTYINFRLQTLGGFEDFNKTTAKFFGSANLSSSINYFISYRTSLNFSLAAVYNYNIHEPQRYRVLLPNSFRLFANAGIVVNI